MNTQIKINHRSGNLALSRNKTFLYQLKKNKILMLMLLPAIVYFIVFDYIPLTGLIVAFKNYNYRDGLFMSPWAGFENFRFFFLSGKAWTVTKNTVFFNLLFIIVNNLLEIVMSIFLAELVGKWFKKLMQSFMFLPFFISWVTVSAFAYNLFNFEYGLLNTLLKSLNVPPIDIYSNGDYWKYILMAFSAWKNVGYGTIIYLAAIMGIDAECYEAAEIDGANIFQKTWHITLPLLTPTIVILVLLRLGQILRGDFEMFYQLVGNAGTLYDKTDVIDTFVFRSLLNASDIGMASAAAFYQSIFCFVFIITVNYIVKKVQKDYALF